MDQRRPLPNATATLVLGILSVVTCFCYGLPGIICAAIALGISGKSVKMYKSEPELYSDYGNLKAGRVIAIIGLILSILTIVFYVGLIALAGSDPEAWQEYFEQLQQNQY